MKNEEARGWEGHHTGITREKGKPGGSYAVHDPVDAAFAARVKQFRVEELGLTLETFKDAIAAHTDMKFRALSSIARIENGRARATLGLVTALAILDQKLPGGQGRGRLYWGWGLAADETITQRPARAIKDAEREILSAPRGRRAR